MSRPELKMIGALQDILAALPPLVTRLVEVSLVGAMVAPSLVALPLLVAVGGFEVVVGPA